jgi:hypothetical protein
MDYYGGQIYEYKHPCGGVAHTYEYNAGFGFVYAGQFIVPVGHTAFDPVGPVGPVNPRGPCDPDGPITLA